MKKSLLPVLLLFAAVATGIWWFWPFGSQDSMRLSGVVEIQEVRLGSKIGGRVYEVYVNEGDEVYPGQKLVVLEAPEWEAQRAQWRERVRAAKAEWDKAKAWFRPEEKEAAEAAARAAEQHWKLLEGGWRIEERNQVEAEMNAARAEAVLAVQELQRKEKLYRERSISEAEYDLARSTKNRAEAMARAAEAKHLMYQSGMREEEKQKAKAEYDRAMARVKEIKEGGREEDIRLTEAKYKEAKAKLAEIEVYLNESVIVAPEKLGKARVEVISIRPGDIVAPNQPLVRVLRTDDWWVKIFVPETKMGHLRDRQEVEVYVDTFPGKPFQGIIEQVANISEFTPRNVQSLDERRHQVFAVKVRVVNAEGRFHAGMAAEVAIPLR